MPQQWIVDGHVALRVAKGTLVPVHNSLSLYRSSGKRQASEAFERSAIEAFGGGGGVERGGGVEGAMCALPPAKIAAPTPTALLMPPVGDLLAVSGSTQHTSAPMPSISEQQQGNELRGQAPAARTPGNAPTSSAPFLERYLAAHRQMISLIEERLAVGVDLSEDDRNHLDVQLSLSRALSEGGRHPMRPSCGGRNPSRNPTSIALGAAQVRFREPPEQNGTSIS